MVPFHAISTFIARFPPETSTFPLAILPQGYINFESRRKGAALSLLRRVSLALAHSAGIVQRFLERLETGNVRQEVPLEFCRSSALDLKILGGRFALIGDFFVFNNLALIQGAEASFLDG
jgi:hypothetical protein